jgi:hypothetical protein
VPSFGSERLTVLLLGTDDKIYAGFDGHDRR